MVRLLFFILAVIVIDGSEGFEVMPLRENDAIHVVDYHNTCSRHETRVRVSAFVSCFVNKKYQNRPDLFDVVTRLLDRSKTCIKFATRECRPSFDGFVSIMGKVIELIKEYSNIHLGRLMRARMIAYAERDKIKDFNCVESSLTKDTYVTCFGSVISAYEELLDESETYDLIFQKEVEKAIICTNTANKQCSNNVKIDLNKIVRYILGVKHPEREDMLFEIQSPTEPPKLPLELRKISQENIDNNFETSKLPDSTSHLNSTDFPVIEKENIEVVLKIKRPSESTDFPEDPKPNNFSVDSHEIEPTTFAETTTFTEPTTSTNPSKTEKENSENDTNLPEDTEVTETPVLSELSKSTELPELVEVFKSSKPPNSSRKDNDSWFTEPPKLLKTTQSPKQNLSDSIALNDSKDIVVPENGKDTMIDLSDWEEKSTTFTEPPQSRMITESQKLKDLQNSTDHDVAKSRVAAEIKEDIIIDLSESTTFTEPPQIFMTTESPKLKDLQNSTSLDASKGRDVAETEEDRMIDLSEKEISTAITEHPHLLMTTEPPKLNLPNITGLGILKDRVAAETEEDIMIDLSDGEKFTTITMSPQLLMTTESSKIKNLQNFTGLDASKGNAAAETRKDTVIDPVTVNREAKSTASTYLPKEIDLPKSTMPILLMKFPDLPTSTASTKPPKPTDLSTSTTPTRPPKTTTTSTRRPTRPTKTTTTSTRRPRRPPKTTTTSTRRPTPSAPVHSRSRNTPYDPPRPTEAPKHWYDFIVQPFVSLWRTIKSWFGF